MIKQVINPQDEQTLRIEFMIGNTCNYSCWYCFTGSHEGEYRWTDDLDLALKNLFTLLDHYKKNGKERFEIHLVGGEPTLWPELGLFVRKIKENYNTWISISSNGSRTIRWWKEYAGYFDDVMISVHHEQADIRHIIDVCDTAFEKGIVVNALVLMDTFAWDKCIENIKMLKKSKHKWFINAMEVSHQKILYEKYQKDYISSPVKRYPSIFWIFKKLKNLKRDPKVVLENGKIKKVNRNWISLKKENRFKGWLCNIGVDSLYVDKDGRITGACRTKLFENYNLYDSDFSNKFKPEIKPKICDIDVCGCQPEQLLNKIKLF